MFLFYRSTTFEDQKKFLLEKGLSDEEIIEASSSLPRQVYNSIRSANFKFLLQLSSDAHGSLVPNSFFQLVKSALFIGSGTLIFYRLFQYMVRVVQNEFFNGKMSAQSSSKINPANSDEILNLLTKLTEQGESMRKTLLLISNSVSSRGYCYIIYILAIYNNVESCNKQFYYINTFQRQTSSVCKPILILSNLFSLTRIILQPICQIKYHLGSWTSGVAQATNDVKQFALPT